MIEKSNTLYRLMILGSHLDVYSLWMYKDIYNDIRMHSASSRLQYLELIGISFFFFGVLLLGAGDETQNRVDTKQTLYH